MQPNTHCRSQCRYDFCSPVPLLPMQVPLLLTVHALVSFKAFTLLQPGSGEPALAPDFFTVPSSYKRKLLSEVMDKAGKGMFGSSSYGGDPDDDEWGLEPGGAGWFYGGDEGAEYMQEISERAAGAGQGAADSTSGRGYRIGSGLDEEAQGGVVSCSAGVTIDGFMHACAL